MSVTKTLQKCYKNVAKVLQKRCIKKMFNDISGIRASHTRKMSNYFNMLRLCNKNATSNGRYVTLMQRYFGAQQLFDYIA